MYITLEKAHSLKNSFIKMTSIPDNVHIVEYTMDKEGTLYQGMPLEIIKAMVECTQDTAFLIPASFDVNQCVGIVKAYCREFNIDYIAPKSVECIPFRSTKQDCIEKLHQYLVSAAEHKRVSFSCKNADYGIVEGRMIIPWRETGKVIDGTCKTCKDKQLEEPFAVRVDEDALVDLVRSQSACTYETAVNALRRHDYDVVEAILHVDI